MTLEADAVAESAVSGRAPRTTLWKVPRSSARPMGWALADQAVSSLTNFAVVFYVAHAVGATQFGAFSLAYVTYSFALALSRGLATSPLQVRFSGVELSLWKRAVANCTGTAWAAGIVTGACVLLAGALLDGTAKGAFIALGLTLPGLLLQDSWRFAFFSLGRGSKALLNDTVWALGLVLGLALLRLTGHEQVFWFVLAWGASANLAAIIGSLQAWVVPRLSGIRDWISRHRDLGFRYVAEEASINGAGQLRTYGVGLIAGLAAVGYLQAATTVMGPFMVIFLGASLVTVPEGVRALSHSLARLRQFSILVGLGLGIMSLAWGVVLFVAFPRGLGELLLGSIWRPTYPLIIPLTISVIGACFSAGAMAGLHALGAARRSLRAELIGSSIFLVSGLVGALAGGVFGAMCGAAVATWIGAVPWWFQLRAGLQEFGKMSDTPVASG